MAVGYRLSAVSQTKLSKNAGGPVAEEIASTHITEEVASTRWWTARNAPSFLANPGGESTIIFGQVARGEVAKNWGLTTTGTTARRMQSRTGIYRKATTGDDGRGRLIA